jgi:deoxyribonuclease I
MEKIITVQCLAIIRNIICVISLIMPCFSALADPPHTFRQAKQQANQIFSTHQKTLYCGCRYNKDHRIDLASCNMESAQTITRAKQVEWEHMMPAENFGRELKCWQKKICVKKGKRYKGRKCCAKINPWFKQAEAELYNLWPSEGLINQARSNFTYAKNNKKAANYYGCHFNIDKNLRQVEPDNKIKGIVARANLFMSDKYDIELSPEQRQLFLEWNKKFPPGAWEKHWAKDVENIEGYKNYYITGGS